MPGYGGLLVAAIRYESSPKLSNSDGIFSTATWSSTSSSRVMALQTLRACQALLHAPGNHAACNVTVAFGRIISGFSGRAH
jgi:hypothetical protein